MSAPRLKIYLAFDSINKRAKSTKKETPVFICSVANLSGSVGRLKKVW